MAAPLFQLLRPKALMSSGLLCFFPIPHPVRSAQSIQNPTTPILTTSTTPNLVQVATVSQLDHHKSVKIELSTLAWSCTLFAVQQRVMLLTCKSDYVTPLLITLPWLSMSLRVEVCL